MKWLKDRLNKAVEDGGSKILFGVAFAVALFCFFSFYTGEWHPQRHVIRWLDYLQKANGPPGSEGLPVAQAPRAPATLPDRATDLPSRAGATLGVSESVGPSPKVRANSEDETVKTIRVILDSCEVLR